MIQTYAATGLLCAAIAFGAAWQVQSWRYGQQLAEIRSQAAQELATAESTARAREQILVSAKHQAEEAHAVTKKQSQRAIAGARSELDRLRDILATRHANTDPTTSPRTDGAACIERQLLGEGAGHLADLAAEADRLSATLTGLQGYVNAVCK